MKLLKGKWGPGEAYQPFQQGLKQEIQGWAKIEFFLLKKQTNIIGIRTFRDSESQALRWEVFLG